MFYLALFIFVILTLGYATVAWAIVYHIQAYATKGDLSSLMMSIFVLLSLGLLMTAVFFFLRVPWSTLGAFPSFSAFPLDTFQ